MDNQKNTLDKREKYTMKNQAPLHKRNNPRVNGLDESKIRIKGEKNVHLWAKGELFPIDPTTNSHQDFKNVTGLVNFLCNGKKGLLGYCENIKRNCRDLEKMSTIYSVKYLV